jgi:hypothetical protein
MDKDITPTPWQNDQEPDRMIVCDVEGGSIADCAPPGPWMRQKTAEANAAFIVKAANNHAALVDALSDTLNMLRAAHIQCGIHHSGNKRVIKARETLSRASQQSALSPADPTEDVGETR